MANAHPPGRETSPGIVRLYHGTDLIGADDLLLSGVSQVKAAAWNGSGEFWATSVRGRAEFFALSHPNSPPAACFEFDLAEPILTAMLQMSTPVLIRHGDDDYEFLPAGFAVPNQNMANRHVTGVP